MAPLRARLAVGLLLAVVPAASAQTPPPQDCSAPVHRQFDFWLGEWEVTSNGRVAGTSTITLRQGGCLLHEQWTGAQGGSGESFNFYDRTTAAWHQVWVDAGGNVLQLSGAYADGALRLAGETRGPGGPARQKLTFFPNADGTVRQLWESSRDNGATWTVVFDGLYRKQP